MKKKGKMSEFIHNLARGLTATACFLPSVVHHGRGKLPKRKVRPSSNVNLFMYEFNTYLGRPKWFEVDSGVELKVSSNSIHFHDAQWSRML